jgi:hypothetical protein
MVDLGNHEADDPAGPTWLKGSDGGGECGVPTLNLYPMPAANRSVPWYSVIMGPVFALQVREGGGRWHLARAAGRSRQPNPRHGGHITDCSTTTTRAVLHGVGLHGGQPAMDLYQAGADVRQPHGDAVGCVMCWNGRW